MQVEIGAPDEERPDCGRVCVAVECSPVASPAFQGRGGDELGAELTAALERGLYPGPSGRGAGLDLAALSIVAGKSCWVVHVDALLLNMDGNVLDALSIAAKVCARRGGGDGLRAWGWRGTLPVSAGYSWWPRPAARGTPGSS